MPEDETNISNGLLDHHRNDLRKSGLSDSTITSWGCFSVQDQNAHRLKGFAKGVTAPGLALPILPPGALDPTGFTYKADNPRVLTRGGKTRTCKYEFPAGGSNRIHAPRGAQVLFRQPDGREGRQRMVVTEGQKKSEKATQEGIPCVAIPGVWNWFQRFGGESIPIEDLTRIDWPRYTVEICFDSDAGSNTHVRRAERALAQWLAQHGAIVSIVRLPAAADGTKVGLDDYLLSNSAADFEALPRLPIATECPIEDAVEALTADTEKAGRTAILARIADEEHDPSEQERLFKIAHDRTGISLKALRATSRSEAAKVDARRQEQEASMSPPSAEEAQAALEKERQQQQVAVEAILNNAQTTTELRAQTAANGQLVYVASLGEAGTVLVPSSGRVISIAALPPGYHVTEPPPDRSPMTPTGIRQFMDGGDVDPVKLFEEIRNFFAEHVVFKRACVAGTLALWAMATYCYTLFNYFGYIWFTSLGPISGKSLVARMLSMICFNATSPQVDPTPATIFRDLEANCSTLVLSRVVECRLSGKHPGSVPNNASVSSASRRRVRVGDAQTQLG